MIALDPEFVGSLAPPSKLTTAINSTNDTPFARLPRLERLRVQGKADETEITDDSNEGNPSGKKHDRDERERRKMRGKGKSMKRSAILFKSIFMRTLMRYRYLRKQRKNVIDPTAVRSNLFTYSIVANSYHRTRFFRLLFVPSWKSRS